MEEGDRNFKKGKNVNFDDNELLVMAITMNMTIKTMMMMKRRRRAVTSWCLMSRQSRIGSRRLTSLRRHFSPIFIPPPLSFFFTVFFLFPHDYIHVTKTRARP